MSRAQRWLLSALTIPGVALAGCSSSSTTPPGCTQNSECDSGICHNQKCVDCLQDADCKDTSKQCVENRCVERASCAGGQPCAVGICINDVCMDCLTQADCPANNDCVGNICTPAAEVCEGAATCSNHGSCDDSGGTIVCTCEAGYTGDRCADCAADYHREGADCVADATCQVTSCSGHGTCDDAGGVIVCTCETGYAGDACADCAGGYHLEGTDCVLDATCQATSCSGHGTCDDAGGEVVCSCEEGYTGDHCGSCAEGFVRWPADDGVCVDDPCDPDPCTVDHAEEGSCVQTGEMLFSCNCLDGTTWAGTACVFEACVGAAEGDPCSGGTGGCEDRCNAAGECVSSDGQSCGSAPCESTCLDRACSEKNGNNCGGTGACSAACLEGQCDFPAGNACGADPCTGTCSQGSCIPSGEVDCGTCCSCGADGNPAFDAAQDADCNGGSTNPCAQQCADIHTCAFPGDSTSCGYGPMCAGSCDGAGACSTQGVNCCSSADPRDCSGSIKVECLGTCSDAGICSSAREACGTCVEKCTCGYSGICHCGENDCSVCAGATLVKNICALDPPAPDPDPLPDSCCPVRGGNIMLFSCCPTDMCISKSCVEL